MSMRYLKFVAGTIASETTRRRVRMNSPLSHGLSKSQRTLFMSWSMDGISTWMSNLLWWPCGTGVYQCLIVSWFLWVAVLSTLSLPVGFFVTAKPERLPVPKAGLRQKHFHGNIHCPICVLKYHFQKNKQTSFHICKFIPQNAYGAPTIGKFW